MLVGLGQIDAGTVFWLILVQNGVALVVAGFADQPTEDAAWVTCVEDTGIGVFAIESEDVVFGNGPPMHVAVAFPRPAFDAGKEPLDARAVAVNDVGRIPVRIDEAC